MNFGYDVFAIDNEFKKQKSISLLQTVRLLEWHLAEESLSSHSAQLRRPKDFNIARGGKYNPHTLHTYAATCSWVVNS